VYLNGSHLSPADFTASNGSDVVLGVAASADDVCDIISYTPFEVADATFTGTTTTDVSLTTGVLTANGGAVFNEGSADVDFRVESNLDTHALFVDGAQGGAVGIGVTPEVWSSTVDFLQVGSAASFWGTTNNSVAIMQANAYFNASNAYKYINTDQATQYLQVDGTHVFSSAVSGSADAAVTFVESLRINADSIVTMPKQPAFLVVPASTQANFAVGSEVDVVFGTERFDQNADFASSVFTAPVTGKYQFNVQLRVENIDTAANYYYFGFKASNRLVNAILDLGGHSADIPYYSFALSMLIDMDASDTCKVVIFQSNGTAQVDISTASHFSGHLVA